MNFGEKIKQERIANNLTQQQLANELSVSLRTIQSYEKEGKLPRHRETFTKLSEILNVDVNYLLSDDENFTVQAGIKYGSRGAKQAKDLVEQIGGLFAGGELSEQDRDGIMKAMQDFYWKAKEENKKYTPNKYKE